MASWINHKSLHTNSSDLEKLTRLLLFNNNFITRLSFNHNKIERFESVRQEGNITLLYGKSFYRSFTNIHQFVKCLRPHICNMTHKKWRTTCKFEWLEKLSKIVNLLGNLSNTPNWISGLLIQIYIFPKLTSKKNIKYKIRKQTGNFEIPCTKCLNLMILFAKVDFSYHIFSRFTFA